jgi:PRTRC genetic system ThiF family protein
MKSKASQIDLSFARAASLILPPAERWRFVLVGCGGTGSWLAPSIARICRVLTEQGKEAEASFIDHDLIEEKNIPRQNFCQAEMGANKARTLALRFASAWGVELEARAERFQQTHLYGGRLLRQGNLIVIGCVDNAAARVEISKALKTNNADVPHDVWWLDCGNTESAGQVIAGSAAAPKDLRGAFLSRKVCKALPSPALVAPDLLKPRPEEKARHKLSCAEIQLADAQSIAVNQQVAALATDYLLRMVWGGLKRFATYFDLESGSMRSRYISPEEIAAAANCTVDHICLQVQARRTA